ncbi:MAG: helix-turn-helix domain-containing protein [Acidocella sp.]|nr:helix-turn-helix domain-containing protein [Acidocella sp.]
MPAHLGTAVERLALTLLNLAEAFEVEAGLTVHITPALAPEELAALAGGTARTVALLLEQLCKDGVVFQRRRRLVLSNPAALHMLALGQVPELAS